MEFLRQTAAQIAQQLNVLNRSQKIAIGLCAVVVAGSLIWLVQYSSAPEMVPVLAQDFPLDKLDSALQALQAERIPAQQFGNRILVRAEDRSKALLVLNRVEALPRDISIGFEEVLADSDPFRPRDENQWRRQIALGGELGKILSGEDWIESSRVIIQQESKRRLGEAGHIKPSASVQIRIAAGFAFDQGKAHDVCRFVSSAVPGLELENVAVRDARTGRTYSPPDPDDAFGVGLLEERKRTERHLAEKIERALQWIPGIQVAVSVELDPNKTSTVVQAWDKPQVKSEESTSTITESGRSAGESGVNPNVGASLTQGSSGDRSEAEESRTEFADAKPLKVENIEKAPFTLTRRTASIRIPRSFLVEVYREAAGGGADTTKLEENQEYLRLRQQTIENVHTQVKTILIAEADTDVHVEEYHDFAVPDVEWQVTNAGMLPDAGDDAGMAGFFKRHAMQMGLGALALISFFVMSGMVRRSSRLAQSTLSPEHAASDEETSDELLQVSGGPVGKAGATDGLLVGEEVDEETLRMNELGEQISKMVDMDPESVAEMIRRWTTATN